MKKNISINLQGIIFHIEEDGYEQLSRYLASIRTYFSTYEGHEEIVADIESRIAEIFSSKLSPGKEVITQEDVDYLINRMGDVTDFEVIEETTEEGNYKTGPEPHAAQPKNGPKKLYRDLNRKVISGVCAGIANYLTLDPLWVRLFFVLLVVLGVLSAGVSAATGIIIYVLLWVAMPQSEHLPETTVKKLFRDPEDKKIAGVASGIAKYFGVDVAVIRILFLVLIFAGGFGFIAYIVLWIAMPEAVTLTERMQMQGDPVTLAGIEQTLKNNLNMHDSNGEETALAKIILLPIRLISQLFRWLSNSMGPLLAALITLIRVAAGSVLLIVALGLSIGLVTAFMVSMGVFEEPEYLFLGDVPASVFLAGFPMIGLIACFIACLIPLIFLIILAISLLVKQTFLKPILGWSLFGVWLVSVFTLVAIGMLFSSNFRRQGEVTSTRNFEVSQYGTLVLDAYDNSPDYDQTYIDVQEHNGDDVEVVLLADARGRTEEEAQENARMISYRILQQDSVLRFDNSYEFKKGAIFRDQELDLVLKLPKDKPLRITREFTYMLPSATFIGDYSRDKIVRNTWKVSGDQLECLTCASDTLDTETTGFDVSYREEGDLDVDLDIRAGRLDIKGSVLLDERAYGNESRTFNFKDFDQISISGPYHLQLKQGNNYLVKVKGNRTDIDHLDISKSGDELSIQTRERYFSLLDDRAPILIQVTAPNFSEIDLSGAVKADIGSIKADKLNIILSGATKTTAHLDVDDLMVDISGASINKFSGRAKSFELEATGVCGVDAEDLRAEQVEVDASGASLTEVYATSLLRADAAGTSKIVYKGNPDKTIFDSSGASKISRR